MFMLVFGCSAPQHVLFPAPFCRRAILTHLPVGSLESDGQKCMAMTSMVHVLYHITLDLNTDIKYNYADTLSVCLCTNVIHICTNCIHFYNSTNTHTYTRPVVWAQPKVGLHNYVIEPETNTLRQSRWLDSSSSSSSAIPTSEAERLCGCRHIECICTRTRICTVGATI